VQAIQAGVTGGSASADSAQSGNAMALASAASSVSIAASAKLLALPRRVPKKPASLGSLTGGPYFAVNGDCASP